MPRRFALLLAAVLLACTVHGWSPAGGPLPCTRSAIGGVQRTGGAAMLSPLLETPSAAPLMEAPSMLLADSLDAADAFQFLAGLANSPLILLVPIGAGTVVASIIIFILVKSSDS